MQDVLKASGGPELFGKRQPGKEGLPFYEYKGVFSQARVRPPDAPGSSFLPRPIFPDVRGTGRYYDPNGTLSGTVPRAGIRATASNQEAQSFLHHLGNA